MRRTAGFTVIELVVVIAISGLLTGMMVSFITRPMGAYIDVARRAGLVDLSEESVRRIARDIRRALPNSLRIAGSDRILELLHTADGSRYRAQPGTNSGTSEDHSATSDWLDLGGDTSFNLMGRFESLSFTYGSARLA